MYGWMAINKKYLTDWSFICENVETIEFEDYLFARKHNGRFFDDTLFVETSDYVVILDGIVLNKKELIKKYEMPLLEIVLLLYEKGEKNLPTSLRGPFSGCIFDKREKRCYSFTNHTGDSGVFYYKDDCIVSNNFRWLSIIVKKNDIRYSLDINAVRYLCTFGYMLDNTTYIDVIKRLMPSEAIIFKNGKKALDKYHVFNNYDTIDWPEERIIEEIDRLFRQAIDRNFSKDREYNYTSIVDLSGGLDARTINYVAKDMGFDNILNVSFSQTFSDEYKAMIMLSRDLGFKLFHYPLDNATHLYDVDKIVAGNYGLSFYAGSGALMSIMENINLEVYGLEHGGILGEMADGVFPGSWYKTHIKPSFEKGMPFFRVLDLALLDNRILDEYENLELFTIFGRGMMGGACTQLIRRHYTGYVSPFEDIDFYDFFLSIPVEIRGEGKILHKWINEKYPQAFNIVEDKLMCKPNASKLIKAYKLFIKKVKGKINQYFGKMIPNLALNNMNPMDSWYESNAKLRNFITGYYDSTIHLLDNNDEAKEILNKMFKEGSIGEKLAVLTVLSAVKQFL